MSEGGVIGQWTRALARNTDHGDSRQLRSPLAPRDSSLRSKPSVRAVVSNLTHDERDELGDRIAVGSEGRPDGRAGEQRRYGHDDASRNPTRVDDWSEGDRCLRDRNRPASRLGPVVGYEAKSAAMIACVNGPDETRVDGTTVTSLSRFRVGGRGRMPAHARHPSRSTHRRPTGLTVASDYESMSHVKSYYGSYKSEG